MERRGNQMTETHMAMTALAYAKGQIHNVLIATAASATIHEVIFCKEAPGNSDPTLFTYRQINEAILLTPTAKSANAPKATRPAPDARLYPAPKRAPVEAEYPTDLAVFEMSLVRF